MALPKFSTHPFSILRRLVLPAGPDSTVDAVLVKSKQGQQLNTAFGGAALAKLVPANGGVPELQNRRLELTVSRVNP